MDHYNPVRVEPSYESLEEDFMRALSLPNFEQRYRKIGSSYYRILCLSAPIETQPDDKGWTEKILTHSYILTPDRVVYGYKEREDVSCDPRYGYRTDSVQFAKSIGMRKIGHFEGDEMIYEEGREDDFERERGLVRSSSVESNLSLKSYASAASKNKDEDLEEGIEYGLGQHGMWSKRTNNEESGASNVRERRPLFEDGFTR